MAECSDVPAHPFADDSFLVALVSDKYNSPDVFLKLWNDDNYNHGSW